jgi:hypothetical protein
MAILCLTPWRMAVQKMVKLSVNKVFPFIIDNDTRYSKSRENHIIEKTLDDIGIRPWTDNYLYPFGHVVHRNQDIFIPFLIWEWPP